jgi:thymidylate synthase (FAD)
MKKEVLNKGYVKLLNLSGPIRRKDEEYDADDVDPAHVARTSFDKFDSERTREQDIKLVKYLINNHHNTPIEMIETWWEIKCPIFVARQWFRHRTASGNEISGRYLELNNDFWTPLPEEIGHRPDNMKQGRVIDGNITPEIIDWLKDIEELDLKSYEIYKKAIKNKIPPEVARTRLPLATYTKFVWHQDLHNLIHFLKLRMDSHAQYEIRQYAHAMYDMLNKYLPDIMSVVNE